MDAFSVPHILIMLVVLTTLVPTSKILRRTGHSGWWSLLAFIPALNWVGFWVLAFVRWPAVDKTS